MFVRLSTALALMFLTGCMGSGTEPTPTPAYLAPAAPPPDLPVQADRSFVPGERFGAIEAGMTIVEIEGIYGAENLVSEEVDVGEGMTEPAYVLFPGTRDEAIVRLGEDKQPGSVTVRNENARWYAPKPAFVMMKASLRELQESNGRPFVFRGFGWDRGGVVTDWRGGRLEGVRARLTYATERVDTGGLPEELVGDVPVRSDAEALENLDLRVDELVVDISAASD
ncbi:hypothetical protein [Neolewinella sp.]|uniref:hypothetical protein n=1 Tax=Neolewinella sp. TaxID=2993543 RepID=UPI003B523D97